MKVNNGCFDDWSFSCLVLATKMGESLMRVAHGSSCPLPDATLARPPSSPGESTWLMVRHCWDSAMGWIEWFANAADGGGDSVKELLVPLNPRVSSG